MEHPYEHIVDLILAFLITFLFPILYFGLKLDAITQIIVQSETSEFVQDIRSKGYIDKGMYESYLDELAKTNVLFDIRLEHKRQNLEPEYRFRTPEEIIDEQNNAYKGKNEYNYRQVSTEIPNVKDPIDNSGGLNTETNESILENAVRTPANPNHVHTDKCYLGHRHTGSSKALGGCYTSPIYHKHTSSCYETYTYTHTHNSYCYITTSCPGPMYLYYDSTNVYKNGHCEGNTEYINVGKYVCSSCGYATSSGYVMSTSCTCGYSRTLNPASSRSCSKKVTSLNCGLSEGEHTGSRLRCSKSGSTIDRYSLGCGLTEDKTIDCQSVIVNISSTHPTQTIYINDPLITTATATYLDGSTNVILCTASFSSADLVQNKIVTLNYKNPVDGRKYTCNITVNVIPRNTTCLREHKYNLNPDGSNPGCPFCRAYLDSLVITYPTSGRITIYKGTTLQENEVMLLATYMDGRKEYLSTGYVDNLDKNYVGTQTVTISYKGKYTTLIVTTKRNLRLCPICNRYYELYPDDTDPGCPYCIVRTPVFTGNVLEYVNKYYESDILKKLYEENETYYFSNRDYFTVTITNRTSGRGMGLLRKIFKSVGEEYIHVTDGGYIREEIPK